MQTKELFRNECLQKMRLQSTKNNYCQDRKINHKILNVVKKLKAKRVLVYLPLKIEADIKFSINHMRRNGIKIFVPYVQNVSFKMVPYRLPLRVKRFNLLHADNSFRKIKKIDLALVPAVGVDANFKRVGFGKGMYDRFFANFAVPFVIFVQRIGCLTNNKVTDNFDVAGSLLVTAKKNYIQGYKRDDIRNSGDACCSSVGNSRVYSSKKNRSSKIRYLCRAVKVQG